MQNPLIIGVIVFGVILVGTFASDGALTKLETSGTRLAPSAEIEN